MSISEFVAGAILILGGFLVPLTLTYLLYVSTCPPGKSWPQRKRKN